MGIGFRGDQAGGDHGDQFVRLLQMGPEGDPRADVDGSAERHPLRIRTP
jgi:hypothetical protein